MEQHKMTDEMKNKLVGLLPVNNDFTINFTPEAYKDIPDEFKPVFVLKPWNNKEVMTISKTITKNPNDEEFMLEIIRKQIVNLLNLINLSTEEQMAYEADPTGGLNKLLYSVIPQRVKLELFGELARISGIKA
jgi:hypothetical protein